MRDEELVSNPFRGLGFAAAASISSWVVNSGSRPYAAAETNSSVYI